MQIVENCSYIYPHIQQTENASHDTYSLCDQIMKLFRIKLRPTKRNWSPILWIQQLNWLILIYKPYFPLAQLFDGVVAIDGSIRANVELVSLKASEIVLGVSNGCEDIIRVDICCFLFGAITTEDKITKDLTL